MSDKRAAFAAFHRPGDPLRSTISGTSAVPIALSEGAAEG